MTDALDLRLLDGSYAILRLEPHDPLPAWAMAPSPLQGMLRTAEELTIICREASDNLAPIEALQESRRSQGWRALGVIGPLDFSLVGILASLSATLAEAGVSIFALSTFDTDYILVQGADLETAMAALRDVGHGFPS